MTIVWTELLVAGLVVAVGALVQGAVGFGMALVATPLLALIDPSWVPVPVLVVATAIGFAGWWRERDGTDWPGVGWALLGRLPGTALGTYLVVTLSPRVFTVTVALIVLVCVLVSFAPVRVRPAPPALLGAGVVAGVSGTAAAIGGPPVALLYQHESGPRIRATLAAFFLVGTAVSLAGLGLGGAVDAAGLLHGLLLLPFLLVGFLASGPARPLVDRGATRPAVLGLSALAALGLLAQGLFG
ncbi:sulfite exporter TauE/SafE family protein [Pseudonocardia spirodelae]|uniref:Probable membrane transporter protein n=1 Tax=Pseudonocardia spirodelae TaxID=3133431 RepID=A0ABU8TDV9_9PSEU